MLLYPSLTEFLRTSVNLSYILLYACQHDFAVNYAKLFALLDK